MYPSAGRGLQYVGILGGLVAAATVWVGACAQGTSETEEGGGATPNVGGSHAGGTDAGGTTAGGGGGQGGAAGGAAGSGGVAGQGGTGPCTEDPCKLTLPQCGCPPSEKCTWSNDSRYCKEDGTDDWKQACVTGSCKAGHYCAQFIGPPKTCFKFCEADEDCEPPGGLCVLQLGENDPEKLCSVNCDAVTSTGCSADGTKCSAFQDSATQAYFTLCIPEGSGVHQDPCTDTTDCASGYECFTVDTDQMCLQWCNVNQPFCYEGTCQPTPIIVGGAHYGGCL